MDTKILVLEDYISTGKLSETDREKLKEAAAVIKNGGLAAFPTETVYGLGGNALMKDAAKKIYAAKGRPSDNPLIVHISDLKELKGIVRDIPEAAGLLSERFWPGPMTMIFNKAEAIPYETTGGLDTVAVRFPSDPVASLLISYAKVPIAAPSANLSGRPSTTSAEHCIEDLSGRVDMIVDGGSCRIGLESTIIDVTGREPVLLRPGAVTKEMLESVLKMEVIEDAAIKGPLKGGIRPKAPGMKYRHYAPKAPMVLVAPKAAGHTAYVADKILEILRERQPEFKKIAVLCSEECLKELEEKAYTEAAKTDIRLTGSRSDTAGIARGLFKHLREFDEDEADFIIAEGYPEDELGLAVMNRLKKAAAWQLIYV